MLNASCPSTGRRTARELRVEALQRSPPPVRLRVLSAAPHHRAAVAEPGLQAARLKGEPAESETWRPHLSSARSGYPVLTPSGMSSDHAHSVKLCSSVNKCTKYPAARSEARPLVQAGPTACRQARAACLAILRTAGQATALSAPVQLQRSAAHASLHPRRKP